MTSKNPSVVQICSAREAIYGAVQSLLSLARAQRANGKNVSFITFAGKKFGEDVRREGFPSHEFKVRGKVDFIAIAAIARYLRHHPFSIVHTHLSTSSVNGALAARLAGVPSVATVHGMSGHMSFFAADHLIAVSNGVKAHLVAQGVRPERITVVHNGLDGSFAPPSRELARAQLGLGPDVPIIGTVSRVTAMKAIDDGLRAVARLRHDFEDLRYLVVGDGDALAACEKLAAELGIQENVIFLGYRKDVATCLAAMDVFLFPSLKEAMGIALVEAMSCGLPIVTTNVDGIPEVITPESGILVGPRQPDALALAVKGILSQPALALELSESARRRAERLFSVQAMESATDAVYRRVLGWQPANAADENPLSNPIPSRA